MPHAPLVPESKRPQSVLDALADAETLLRCWFTQRTTGWRRVSHYRTDMLAHWLRWDLVDPDGAAYWAERNARAAFRAVPDLRGE